MLQGLAVLLALALLGAFWSVVANATQRADLKRLTAMSLLRERIACEQLLQPTARRECVHALTNGALGGPARKR